MCGCACFFGRVVSKGDQKNKSKQFIFEFVSEHSGLGWGVGWGLGLGVEEVPENQHEYEKVKKKKKQTQRTQIYKYVFFEIRGDLLKNWTAQRLGVYCGIMKKSDKKVIQTIAQRK